MMQVRAAARERAGAPAPEKRGMFDGLTLNPRRPAPDMGRVGDLPLAGPDRAMPVSKPPLEQAAERYARALDSAERMRAQTLPLLEHQKREMREAARALDGARPGAVRDMHDALRHEITTWRAMRDLRGAERGTELAGAIRHEARVRRDPALKADRLVKEWQRLEAQHGRLDGWRHGLARGRLETRMKTMAGTLKRDPQLESLVRARAPALGVGPGSALARVLAAPTVQRAAMEIGMGRDRGLSR